MGAESTIKRGHDAVGAEPHSEKVGEAQKKKSSGVASKRWTPEQDEALRLAVAELGQRNWMAVAEHVPGRDNAQCLQRWNKVLKPGLVKGPWSVEEDAILMEMMLKGYDNWRQVSNSIPGRTAKQCRERWRNRLDPSINKSPFTEKEDHVIQQAYEKYGNRWTQIAELLPGRTEDAVKLRWKALNPNQKTYTKLGRPRLLNSDDVPPVSTSYVHPTSTPAHPLEIESPQMPVIDNASDTNLEPIVTNLEDATDERMSEEDIMILNEFLRGHSNQSLESRSFKSLLSASSFCNTNEDIDAAIMKMESQPDVDPLQSTGSKPLSCAHSPHRVLDKMLSLGETKSASLRSITADVEPDDSWINGGLTRRLSSLSVGGDGSFERLESMDSFEQQLASLNDASSLMNLPLDYNDGTKTDNTVASIEAGNTDAATTTSTVTQDSLQRSMTDDNIAAYVLPTSSDPTTMTAQDFYSIATPHDQLSKVNRFEI